VVLPKTGGFGAVIWGRSVDATPVLLTPSGMQTGKAVRLERTLPGEELVLRELVAAQSLLHCDPAAAHGSHHCGFAAGDPPNGIRRWQIVHLATPTHAQTVAKVQGF
jgi:hypothetical protein